MTGCEIEPPSGWRRRPDEDHPSGVLVEYQHTTAANITYIVSILQPTPTTDRYKLRLSVVDEASPYVRHDYPVNEYDQKRDVIDEAESLLVYLTERFTGGLMPETDPEGQEMRAVIEDFQRPSSWPSLQRLFRRFR